MSSETRAWRTEKFIGRREFVATLLAVAAAPAGWPAVSRAAKNVVGTTPSIARAAVIHDAMMLLISDEDVTGEWQEAIVPLPIGKPYEFSYAYGVASLDAERLVEDVVDEVRSEWENRPEAFLDIQRHKGGMLERHLQVALGAAANQAATAELFTDVSGDQPDLVVDAAFLRDLLRLGEVNPAYAHRMFRLLYERALVAMHTIEPDLDGWGDTSIASMHELESPRQADVNRYMDAYADWVGSIDRRCADLASALAQGSTFPAGSFYRARDPVIARAEGLRRGIGATSSPGHWSTTSGDSRYASALSAAYTNVRLVLDVARGARSTRELANLRG